MKTKDQLKPNYGPAYAAAMYPDLAAIFHRHGYALACHGSLARDFDLIAVPWSETVSKAEDVLKDVTSELALTLCGEPEQKKHGRIAYTLACGFGECAIDLSFLQMVQFVELLKSADDALDSLGIGAAGSPLRARIADAIKAEKL